MTSVSLIIIMKEVINTIPAAQNAEQTEYNMHNVH